MRVLETGLAQSADTHTTSPARLTAEMASFRLLVLAFVRDYLAEMGESPSYGEIAAGLDSNRTRVRKAVKSLAADGLLLRRAGKSRGLSLPSIRQEAIRQLRELGWTVDEDNLSAAEPVTKPPLLPPPALDYVPPGLPLSQDGDRNDETSHRAGKGSRRAPCEDRR
ncbi:GntR family transcriptional regulator [Erythrobacter litoralis]|uniref:LexA family protein n=1 Tax=Erythrobacter litoralis TaxID=39960 RepID=UPI002435250D|nr:GntR family transcriptional regulator [Erythrobacter litoralis]MDG6079770.1 GntR family transcriptional regulator [Erythrobacter litoralis]